MKKSPTSQSDGILGLVREAIDGLGDLVGQHLSLARLELVSDLRAVGRRTKRSLIFGVLAFFGYGLALVGLAVFLGGQRAIGAWLMLFGGIHLAGAGIVFLLGRARESGKKLMDTNLEQVGESIATLQRAVTGGEVESPANALPANPVSQPSATKVPVGATVGRNGQSAPAHGGPGR
ncbi:MAG TPA: phage holin family protein [Polyangia bacterium]